LLKRGPATQLPLQWVQAKPANRKGKGGEWMTLPQRSIFRTEAVRRYFQDQQEAVLPQFLCPRTFLYLWIFLVLLLVAGCFVTWRARGLLLAPPAMEHQARTVGSLFRGHAQS
jgi:hypothetical protein